MRLLNYYIKAIDHNCPPRTPTRQTCKSVLFLNFYLVTDVFTVFKSSVNNNNNNNNK